VRRGRLRFAGPGAWPDHVLSYDVGSLLVGAVFQVRGFALGFELHGRRSWNPWLGIYLGLWAFEVYFDADRSFEEEPLDA
jgi:hypothetical protein